MASPKESIPAYGSSHSRGGTFRGRAQGNTFNMGDVQDVWNDINLYADNVAQKPEKGKVHFYISDRNPSEVIMDQSSFSATIHDINKCQTIQSVIERSSQDYSPIHRKSVIFIYSSLLINLFRSCISSVYM
jgi:hypothetical protein